MVIFNLAVEVNLGDKTLPTSSPNQEADKFPRYYVTSRSLLKDENSQPSRAINRQVYLVTPSPEPHIRPESRCTNVTATLNKSIVTPVIENAYARVDPGISSRYSGGNSITRVPVDFSNMSYVDRMYSTGYQTGGYQTGYQQSSSYQTSGYKTTSGGGLASTLSMTRSQEKEELQRINDRFTAYIQKVRMLREHSNQLDSSAFIKSAKVLEEEVANLKNLYESELENIRYDDLQMS